MDFSLHVCVTTSFWLMRFFPMSLVSTIVNAVIDEGCNFSQPRSYPFPSSITTQIDFLAGGQTGKIKVK